MKKVVILVYMFFCVVSLNAVSNSIYYNLNYDKKIYYDANRDENEKKEQMAKILEKFINNEANESLINEYKKAKLKLSKDEIKLQDEAGMEVNSKENKKRGFFSNLFSFGSDKNKNNKKINKQNKKISKKEEKPSFFAKLLEKIGIGSTKRLPVKSKQEVPNEKK